MKRNLFSFLALVLAGVVGGSGGSYAEVTEPVARDKYITMTVTALMKREHISKRSIDEEMSQRTLDNMLKMLDPQKVYFYQSDVDALRAQQSRLGEMFRSGEIKIAYVIFKTFLARVDERVATIQELLHMPVDFTVEEELVTDRDLLTYPKNSAEARERLRKRVKYELLLLQMDEMRDEKAAEKKTSPEAATDSNATTTTEVTPNAKEEPEKTPEEKHQEGIEKLAKRYSGFAKRMHQMDNDDLLEMYLTAMTTGFDPHTSYMAPRTLENFDIAMRLELEGIGASLTSEDGYVVVKRLVPGGAAEKEGSLKVDDKISGVGQDTEGPMEDVVDMKLDDVVKKIRGKRGTVVRLEVIPNDGGPKKIVQITRSKIELKDSEAKGEIFEAGKKADGTPYKIGVINLPSFYMDMQAARIGFGEYKSTTRDVRRILENFLQNGVDAVILDLRTNGGGSLPESINLTGLFIDSGVVVQVKDAYGKVSPYDDTEAGALWKGPLVVVINKLSASASEILAGAIQDYKRGLIVGDATTHGKGTVQTLIDIGNVLLQANSSLKLGALKVTMQQFYRPLGDSTQNRGVESDIEIPAITTYMDIGEADLDFAMPFDKIAPQPIQSTNLVNDAIVTQLREKSQQRIAQSEDFQKLIKKINFYRQQKDRKSVTLHAERFLSERADMLDEEEENLEKQELQGANEIERDFYLDEVINITLDYIGALAK
ncbi:MAG: carboxy terminal-processing peptidase [Planctomycetia bacterium]|nr:carboxy terminal-processing peptidase [Planctomycetia bacterium]